jgi:uncharacterized protein involved in exopolysaccharide biosynthesis
MEQSKPSFNLTSLRDILGVVFKHKWKIVITFLTIAIVSVMARFLVPVKYVAKSVLLVKSGREFIPRNELGERTANVVPQSVIATEIKLLTGSKLIADVVKTLGNGVSQFEKNLKVESVSNTGMIEVSYINRDPQIAVGAVRLLVEKFKDKHLQVFSSNSTEFLEQQFDKYQSRLQASESDLASFKQKNRIISLDEQRSSLLAQRTVLESSLASVQGQIRETEFKLSLARSSSWSSETPAEARTQLLALEQKERELLEKYNENSERVQAIRKDIQNTKQGLQDNARKEEVNKVQYELKLLNVKAEGIKKQLGEVAGELQRVDARTLDFQHMKREIASDESNYQTYMRRLEDARISDDMDRKKVVAISVLEEPTATLEPKTKKIRDLAIPAGLIGGILAGLFLAFLLELLTPTMTTPLSAELRLDIPSMVAITKKE